MIFKLNEMDKENKKDARFNSISLTKYGKNFMKDCQDDVENFEKILIGNLDNNEKKELIRLLGKVLKSIEEDIENG